jgi:hypothetical protein
MIPGSIPTDSSRSASTWESSALSSSTDFCCYEAISAIESRATSPCLTFLRSRSSLFTTGGASTVKSAARCVKAFASVTVSLTRCVTEPISTHLYRLAHIARDDDHTDVDIHSATLRSISSKSESPVSTCWMIAVLSALHCAIRSTSSTTLVEISMVNSLAACDP